MMMMRRRKVYLSGTGCVWRNRSVWESRSLNRGNADFYRPGRWRVSYNSTGSFCSSVLLTSPQISQARDSYLHITLPFRLTWLDRADRVRTCAPVTGASELSNTRRRWHSETFRHEASGHDVDQRAFRTCEKSWKQEEGNDYEGNHTRDPHAPLSELL